MTIAIATMACLITLMPKEIAPPTNHSRANCDGSSKTSHGFVLVKKRSSIDATRRCPRWTGPRTSWKSAPKRVVQSRGVQID